MTETTDTRHETRLEVLLLMLMGIVILLMIAIIGLFVRMNLVQKAVLEAAAPLKAVAQVQADRAAQMPGGERPANLEVGVPAPSFVLTDTTGMPVSLADFAGQTVLLAFSSTHCKGCSEMYPELGKFSPGQNDVQVVVVSIGTEEESRQIVQTQEFAFPMLPVSDWSHEVFADYQVNSVPFFYVINKSGVIAGAGSAHTREQIATLLSEAGMHREE